MNHLKYHDGNYRGPNSQQGYIRPFSYLDSRSRLGPFPDLEKHLNLDQIPAGRLMPH